MLKLVAVLALASACTKVDRQAPAPAPAPLAVARDATPEPVAALPPPDAAVEVALVLPPDAGSAGKPTRNPKMLAVLRGSSSTGAGIFDSSLSQDLASQLSSLRGNKVTLGGGKGTGVASIRGTGGPGPGGAAGGTSSTPRAKVRIVGVQVHDPDVTESAVRVAIGARAGVLTACYQRALATRPTLAGDIDIDFAVGKSGRIVEILASRGVDDTVRRCMERALRSMALPKPPADPYDVTLRLAVKPD